MQTTDLMIMLPAGQIYSKCWQPAHATSDIPLIMLHDSLGSVAQWRNFPWLLAENLARPVIAYDRLGFGQSDALDALPAMSFIEDEGRQYFGHIKQAYEIDRYFLLGHSVGGGMAVHIAAQDPDCLGVISISAQAFVEDLTLSGIRNAQQFFSQADHLSRLEKWHENKAVWVLKAWTERWLAPEFRTWNLKAALEQMHCPILAIHGEDDEYGSTAFPEYICTHARQSTQKAILTQCGHLPHREKTAEVMAITSAFIAQLSKAGQ